MDEESRAKVPSVPFLGGKSVSKNDTIFLTIFSIFRDFGNLKVEIDPEMDLYTELGLESNGLMSILVELEEHFEITIDDYKLINARTFNEIVALVRSSIL